MLPKSFFFLSRFCKCLRIVRHCYVARTIHVHPWRQVSLMHQNTDVAALFEMVCLCSGFRKPRTKYDLFLSHTIRGQSFTDDTDSRSNVPDCPQILVWNIFDINRKNWNILKNVTSLQNVWNHGFTQILFRYSWRIVMISWKMYWKCFLLPSLYFTHIFLFSWIN